ncbi:FAD binding domain-containing protein [Pseudonocardia sp. TRM90224]|uniref:FAD binding domain-containing protein n=1 Tax=Pseudonocardia sp. TRM90224 TaxID=2812678 RepID=UPI001E604BC3|nr:FAD binding domain-containing protein [Pseudonocardia sp. TRM90224]
MKLPAFAYHRADSLADAVDALAVHGPEARVLGGGQSLLPLMALRMSVPEVLVDISTAADLRHHEVHDGGVTVGAAVTTRTLETDPGVHPLIRSCLARIGHVEIRTRGTVCGSLAHADPAAELPALLLAVEGSVELVAAHGSRVVPAAEFVAGPYTTSIDDGELVAAATLPAIAASAGWSVREIARRSGDFALVGVICVLDVDRSRRCHDARVVLFGVAATAVRATAAEEALLGEIVDGLSVEQAAELAFTGVDVLGDLHGSAEYRRRAGARLVAAALDEAADRAHDTTTSRAAARA